MAKKTTKKARKPAPLPPMQVLYELVFEALHEHLPIDQAAARARHLVADFKANTED